MVRYSKNFERDYSWYIKYKDQFTFCGTGVNKDLIVPDLVDGKSAKECFYLRDSTGKIIPTNEPELLYELYLTKGSINFHIKQWAEGIAEGTFNIDEFIREFELLPWMITSLNNQVDKLNIKEW